MKSCTDTFCYTKTLLLNGVLYANKYDWENSIKSYESFNEIQPNQNITTINLGIAKSALKLKSKKSGLAAVFSLIPGVGYAYTGHKQTAISSFIVNGLLAFATYSNIRNGNYGMAALTGVFNLSFYISNIYGAANSAKRYNSQQKKSIIDKLEYNTNL
ncbi:MAG: hypothetical protein IPP69_15375 [Flavobacteriales bacterium]|nr:hypothetical protein [Flavobacteriales bacterium]